MAISDTLKAFSDPVRQQVMMLLKDGRMTAGDIAKTLNITSAALSYHLKMLKKADMLLEYKEKNFIWYEINITLFDELILWLKQFGGKYEEKIMWIITFIPLIVTLLVIKALPAEVPMHYDFEGNIDRWGSKYEQLILPIVTIAMSVFMQFIILFYERNAEKTEDEKKKAELYFNINVLYIVSIATTVMFLGLQCAFLYQAWEATPDIRVQTVDINQISSIMIGIMLVVAGNYIPKTKRNSIVGFRLPITMKSDENWKKANRFAGIVLVIAGVIVIVLSLMFEGYMALVSTMMLLLLSLVVCMMYAKRMEDSE